MVLFALLGEMLVTHIVVEKEEMEWSEVDDLESEDEDTLTEDIKFIQDLDDYLVLGLLSNKANSIELAFIKQPLNGIDFSIDNPPEV
ncbi:MAG: hypothetical protein EB023_09560 [Flavobacteriia bacterium]|nr:hypothetical protein [Flavobacteriia bacterium]